MTQNMFQEGLYHVFFKERPPARMGHPVTVTTNQEPLRDVRIGRCFGTVVNTHLLIIGVRSRAESCDVVMNVVM